MARREERVCDRWETFTERPLGKSEGDRARIQGLPDLQPDPPKERPCGKESSNLKIDRLYEPTANEQQEPLNFAQQIEPRPLDFAQTAPDTASPKPDFTPDDDPQILHA